MSKGEEQTAKDQTSKEPLPREADILVRSQVELYGKIARASENLKKQGVANITIGLTEARLQALDNNWAKFEAQHDKLISGFWEALTGQDYLKKDYHSFTEETYLNQKGMFLETLRCMRAKAKEELPAAPLAAPHPPRTTLPRIQLPPFSGRYEDWPPFRDLFHSLIGKDATTTQVEKLHYLKSCLKGEADLLIRNLTTTNENFERAWKALTDYYENKRLLVRSYISQFTALQKLKSESASELRKLYHGVINTVGSLESIGRPITRGEDLFVHLIAELLDSRSRREWENTISETTDPPSYSDLRQFLERHLHTLESLQPIKTETNRTEVSSKTGDNASRQARALHSRPQENKYGRCTLCRKDHYILRCDAYRAKTAEERKKHVETHQLCINCLGKHKLSSESSLISESLAQRLRLPRRATSVAVYGVGGKRTGCARGLVDFRISPRGGGPPTLVSALVLPRLTLHGGELRTERGTWAHLQGLELADPEFLATDSIDILLGADIYANILQAGLRKGGPREPVAQKTKLGWILSGIVGLAADTRRARTHQCLIEESLPALVREFWLQEEAPVAPSPLTPAEQACEESFRRTHTRTAEGRYVVRLPVVEPLPNLAPTRQAALRVLSSMEGRFARDDRLRQLYREFLQQYEDLGHMRVVDRSDQPGGRLSYLPHHGVLRESSSSTKLRVVFNGSTTTASGDALNRHLMVGPNLLPQLADVLLCWRHHRYVLATDVEKMFRQILVYPEDRDLQRIIWRSNKDEELKEYRLNTVTYGLACAPFLAMRALRQLAEDEMERFPQGAEVLRRDVYMDDVLTGSASLAETQELQRQLSALCTAGGFPLRKWASNDDSLLEGVPLEHQMQHELRAWQPHEAHATLGLRWHPCTDCFSFSTRSLTVTTITERSTLSLMSRLYDPPGWLAPAVVKAKIAFQSTWLQGLDWDDPLDEASARQWVTYLTELPRLEEIRIPRWLTSDHSGAKLQLHGFADASERAYAAVLYLRTEIDGQVKTHLIMAKTKVAPLKQVTLPRLELCAATLLARLAAHIRRTLDVTQAPLHLWSDSTVALGWIRGHPTRWQTAVHLEAVSDYTTDAFLAALRRFTSRRGLCRTIRSDCGTNFVGADAQLRAFFSTSSPELRQVSKQLADDQIQWQLNPPSTPHFGGLWEAAVKSLKHHLRRVLGDATLTFEEMSTLLTQIEACLNSRPLQAQSDDPEDLAALTPGHFLVGSALTAVPEPPIGAQPTNRLSRWQLLQQMRDHFWDRWSREYLHSLTHRPKWCREKSAFKVGRLCLVRHESTPPTRWPLARIIRVHQGEDGQIRVVDVRTPTTVLTRPVVKLVLLPDGDADAEEDNCADSGPPRHPARHSHLTNTRGHPLAIASHAT
ncbi:PREDICTED: uncharacterized protein LOC105458737 [Wasmannia auropunctata]|uniref:uncharacterized protein LOC105458737 n=1 Tax=Wasmannia auropunctata TaxID=64793 RepID=UPI0005EDD5FC|nr:PREDICTED: uncharacterized protein LOC105458737 [Wasmannia auropunctata]